ncbi:hypothetical protein [Mammaliicoccus lentus]|uniref:hypothetical protein n=1 Tax=Mammaliicoccus lentus TaxID=42858 RepID=UPI0002DC193A|nr:hypothetical protein [Mammaliicoccus lentus]QMU10072.1 hypothetical protein H3V22_10840 [Mammaliicoccus lentus]
MRYLLKFLLYYLFLFMTFNSIEIILGRELEVAKSLIAPLIILIVIFAFNTNTKDNSH